MSVENNQGPAPGESHNERPALSRQRLAVAQQLRGRSRPVTAAALAQACRLHVNTVREHLDALVGAGLAVRERTPAAGRGRPAYRYRAVPPQQSPAREYAGLAAVLTGQIARSSSDPRRVALAAGQEWGRALVSGQEPAGSPQEARARVLVLLDEIGFAYETDEESRRARLPRCPFIELAREYPGVICAVHAGLVVAGMAALGGEAERVVLQPFAEPGACMLRLDAEPGEGPLAAAPTGSAGSTEADTETSGTAGTTTGLRPRTAGEHR
ncbi:MAG TPA: helix-turn-helix domain-containing protein [Streptomyces sp.]